jgi:hypothetical protein
VVGVLIMNSVRKIFSDDGTVMRRLFEDQPVTMFAAATIVGSVVVWGAMAILGL